MAEDDFLKNLEMQMAGVTGGDGLTDEERRIYNTVTQALQSGTGDNLTREQITTFKKARQVLEETHRKANNPENITVNIRPGVPLKVKRSNGQIDEGWTLAYNQRYLNEGRVVIEKDKQDGKGGQLQKEIPIKDLAEVNDLARIMSEPENVMEWGGFGVLDRIKIKQTGEIRLIHQFAKRDGEVKAKVAMSGDSHKNFKFEYYSFEQIERVPLRY